MIASRLEQLAEDIMNLSQDEAQELQVIIKAKLMPEDERERGLLAEQQQAMPQQPQQAPSQMATQRDVRMAGLLK